MSRSRLQEASWVGKTGVMGRATRVIAGYVLIRQLSVLQPYLGPPVQPASETGGASQRARRK